MILEVKSVQKSFDGFVAVKDLSFTVEKGELCSIIGPNGAGKTTLFNLITSHLPMDKGGSRATALPATHGSMFLLPLISPISISTTAVAATSSSVGGSKG